MPKIKQEMSVIPGVFEALDALRKKYRLAIVSNHHAWLAERLRELKLYEYFESVIISEVVGIEKPDERIMEIALKELGLSPETCLYVGDHPMDILCSKKAGMASAWITGKSDNPGVIGGYKEDFRINCVKDLIGLLC